MKKACSRSGWISRIETSLYRNEVLHFEIEIFRVKMIRNLKLRAFLDSTRRAGSETPHQIESRSTNMPARGRQSWSFAQKMEKFEKFTNFAHLWRTEEKSYDQKSGEFPKRLAVPNAELLKFSRLDLKKVENFQFEKSDFFTFSELATRKSKIRMCNKSKSQKSWYFPKLHALRIPKLPWVLKFSWIMCLLEAREVDPKSHFSQKLVAG